MFNFFNDDRGMVVTAEALGMLLVFLTIAGLVSGILVNEFITADQTLQSSLDNIYGGGF